MIKEIISFMIGLVLGTWKGQEIIVWLIKSIMELI